MAYKKEELEKKALDLIEKSKLIFIADVWPLLGISEKTFYNHKLQELQTIKDKLELNKVIIKTSLRKKWFISDNATLQIALMRLACTDEERRKLAINYNEHTVDITDEQRKRAASLFPTPEEWDEQD